MDNSTENQPFVFSDYTQRAVVAAMILLISLVGIIGNSLVILAVLLSKKLRTATNAFVVNLSIADLLTCLAIPWNAVVLLDGDHDSALADRACKVVAIVQFTCVGCSIYTLASIGLNRLMLITRPVTTYRKIYTPKKIAVWLLVIWLVPLLVSIIPPFLNVGAVGHNRQFHFCGSIPSHPRYNTYNLIIATVLYPTSFIIIIVSYSIIWIHLHRQAKRLAANRQQPGIPQSKITTANPEDVIDMDQPQSPASSSTNLSPAPKTNRQTEVTKNMLYVVCGFCLCLTPYSINLFVNDDSPSIPYTTIILLLNNCTNPLIYATKHRDFKTVFGCILRCKWDDIPKPSESLKAIRRFRCKRSDLSA